VYRLSLDVLGEDYVIDAKTSVSTMLNFMFEEGGVVCHSRVGKVMAAY